MQFSLAYSYLCIVICKISFKGLGYHLPHFLSKFQRLEHFNAIAVAQQFAQKITGGTDVIGEVRIVWRRRELALRVMQGQRAQVIGTTMNPPPFFLLRGAVPNCDFNTSNKTEINCEKN